MTSQQPVSLYRSSMVGRLVLPVGMGVFVMLLFLVAGWRLLSSCKDLLRSEHLEAAQQEVVQVLVLGLRDAALAFERQAYRWQGLRQDDPSPWFRELSLYRRANAHLRGMVWLPESDGMRWSDPASGAAELSSWADPDIVAELRTQLGATRQAQVARVVAMRSTAGQPGELVIVSPLFEAHDFAGWLLARLDVAAFFAFLEAPVSSGDLRLQVLRADGLPIHGPDLAEENPLIQVALDIDGQQWELRLAAGPTLDQRLNLWQIDAAAGFLLLLILILALFLRHAIVRSFDARSLGSTLAIHETVMNTLTDGLILADRDGLMRKVNQATLRIFGYSEQELLGCNVKMLMPEPYQGRHDGYLRRFLATGRKHILDASRKVEGLRKNRSVFPIELFVRHVSIDGTPFFVGVVRDISEQASTSEALESERSRLFETESLLDSAIRSSNVGFALLTLDARLTEVNAAFAALFGLQVASMSGMSLGDTLPAEEWRGIEAALRDVAAGQEDSFTREVRQLRPDGTVFWGLLSASRVLNQRQETVSLAVQVIDIDQEKRLALEVELRALELERSNQDLDRFAYVASHDLKSPLRGIAQLASWIEEDAGPDLGEETRAHLAKMRSRVGRMERLLDDLLTYSRAGRRDESVGLVNVGEMVQALFELLAPPPHFSLRIASVLPVFETRSTPLQLVLRNLLSNSIKHFSGENGVINVSCQVKRGYYEFCVEDNGPGIPPQFQERVFEMFQTLRPRDEVEGSGMGLALVRKVVQQQGGTVRLESDGQHGTKVFFTWPR